MKDRLQLILQMEKLTPKKFADVLGVRPSTISHLLSGRNNPGYDFITGVLSKFPLISPDWLLLGKGHVYRSTTNDNVTLQADNILYKEPVDDLIDNETNQHASIEPMPQPEPVAALNVNYHDDNAKIIDSSINIPADKLDYQKNKSEPGCMIQNENESNLRALPAGDFTNVTLDSDEDIDRVIIFFRNRSFISYKPE